jgi:hypothetical protein
MSFHYGDRECPIAVTENVKPHTVLLSTGAALPAVIPAPQTYPYPQAKIRTQARLPVRVAVTLCQFVRQAMAYKEAKPQSLVRIIASIVARVM